MSSYDAAIIDATILEDPRLLTLPRGYRLMHIEGYVWSRAQRTDGAIPRHMLARVAFDEEDRDRGATALVDAGLWEVTPTGWRIVDFLDTQWSRATVEQKRRDNRRRYSEYVERQREKEAKRVGKRVANDLDADTDTDTDADADKQAGIGRSEGPDSALLRPVGASFRECRVCGRDYLGAGYGSDGDSLCSRKCERAA